MCHDNVFYTLMYRSSHECMRPLPSTRTRFFRILVAEESTKPEDQSGQRE